jgi:hypothetical protein
LAIFRRSWRVACSIRTCSPTMNQIECFSRADLFVQSQRDCAPKPGVAERARLPWVLSHTISSTPTGLCLLLFSHTATDKLWFMERRTRPPFQDMPRQDLAPPLMVLQTKLTGILGAFSIFHFPTIFGRWNILSHAPAKMRYSV